MSFIRPIQWHHSHADIIWWDDTFKEYTAFFLSLEPMLDDLKYDSMNVLLKKQMKKNGIRPTNL